MPCVVPSNWRIGPLLFPARGDKKQAHLAVAFVYILRSGIFAFLMNAAFLFNYVRFTFLVTVQKTSWKECLWNDLISIKLDVKPEFSINLYVYTMFQN